MQPVYDDRREGFTMRTIVSFAIFLLALGARPPAALAQTPNQHRSMPMGGTGSQPYSGITALVPGPLTISFGSHSAEWTQAALAALPHQTVTVYNEHTKAQKTYSGVPLIDLLARLGVPEKPRGTDLGMYLVAEGLDGYKVVYSLGEVCPEVHDATVIVADREDGKPIVADGPLKLIGTREKHPSRWVRNLVAVRVRTAE
jgi:hypothetical protein